MGPHWAFSNGVYGYVPAMACLILCGYHVELHSVSLLRVPAPGVFAVCRHYGFSYVGRYSYYEMYPLSVQRRVHAEENM